MASSHTWIFDSATDAGDLLASLKLKPVMDFSLALSSAVTVGTDLMEIYKRFIKILLSVSGSRSSHRLKLI